MNYVISRKIDFLLIKFPIFFPIAYYILLVSFPNYENYLILFTLLFLAEPHFGATWPFMVDKKNNYIKKENSLTLIYFPILICVFCLAGFFLFSSLFFLIFYLANFFHVTRQSAGISKLYIKDSDQKKFQEISLYLYGAILFIIGFFRFYYPVITESEIIIISLSMIILLIFFLIVHLKLFGTNEIFTFITGMIIFYPMCFVSNPIHAIIMGVTMHYSQYLILTYQVKQRRNILDTKKIKYYFFSFVLIYGVIMTSFSSLGNNTDTIVKNLIIIPIIGQMIHFYLDSFLWKFSNKNVRQSTLPFIFSK
mgnify:CR=1 FL=1|tara:strand:+ start:2014 stop:2937 length:924 start_codon:yes stop_codon:yes gene_type:complete